MAMQLQCTTETYVFAPRQSLHCDAQVVSGRTSKAAGPFKEAVVFLIGGGNYLEYESLSLYASRSQPPKNILYGATDIISPEGFAQQLADLGKRSSTGAA